MKTKQLFKELAPDYPMAKWGHAMSVFFDVAGEIHARGEPVPSTWQYRPGAGGPDISEWSAEIFTDLAPSTGELIRLGTFLHRLTGRLERAGISY